MTTEPASTEQQFATAVTTSRIWLALAFLVTSAYLVAEYRYLDRLGWFLASGSSRPQEWQSVTDTGKWLAAFGGAWLLASLLLQSGRAWWALLTLACLWPAVHHGLDRFTDWCLRQLPMTVQLDAAELAVARQISMGQEKSSALATARWQDVGRDTPQARLVAAVAFPLLLASPDATKRAETTASQLLKARTTLSPAQLDKRWQDYQAGMQEVARRLGQFRMRATPDNYHRALNRSNAFQRRLDIITLWQEPDGRRHTAREAPPFMTRAEFVRWVQGSAATVRAAYDINPANMERSPRHRLLAASIIVPAISILTGMLTLAINGAALVAILVEATLLHGRAGSGLRWLVRAGIIVSVLAAAWSQLPRQAIPVSQKYLAAAESVLHARHDNLGAAGRAASRVLAGYFILARQSDGGPRATAS